MSQKPAVLAGCLALLAAAPPALSQNQQVPRVQERVDVSRVLVDVRVVDDRGMPVQGPFRRSPRPRPAAA